MNSLTKEQRHEVYKESVQHLESVQFMCLALRLALWDIGVTNSSYGSAWVYSYLPEFFAKKPADVEEGDAWTGYSLEDKTAILKQCIDETR